MEAENQLNKVQKNLDGVLKEKVLELAQRDIRTDMRRNMQ